jgi:hypothetical protein
MLLVLLALIAFACAAILAGIQRAWAVALIAIGLALVTLPGLHLG